MKFIVMGVCVLVSAVCVTGCGLESLPTHPELVLQEESGQPLDAVSVVPRFRLRGLVDVPVEDVWLVDGEVSSVSLGRLRAGEIPKVLEEHRLPLTVWSEEDLLVLAPSEFLEDGGRYSFVAKEVGLIGTFDVVDDGVEPLWLWGPPSASLGQTLLYCAARPPLAVVEEQPSISPSSEPEAIREAICQEVSLSDATGEFFVPYSENPLRPFEPTPISLLTESTSNSPELGAVTQLVGPALEVNVEPGVFQVDLSSDADSRVALVETREPRSFLLGPLEPETHYAVRITRIFDAATASRVPVRREESFHTGGGQPRFIINEVLADPLGQEPQSEWVEIINAGTASGSLGGFELWDSGAGVPLPPVTLEPGAFGLIVREDFALGPDLIPDPASLPIPVDQLGASGLRNSGEIVQLRTSEGDIVSEMPAFSTTSGQSVARIDPWAPDVVESFAEGIPTPGSVNFASLEGLALDDSAAR